MRYEAICCPTHERPLFKFKPRARMVDRDRPAIRRVRMRMRVRLTAALKQYRQKVIDRVRHAKTLLGKGIEDDIQSILQALSPEDLEQLLREIKPLLEKAILEGAIAGLSQLPLNMDTEQMLSLVNEFALKYADDRAAELVKGIDEATRKMIRRDVREALEQGLSNDELARMLEDNYAFSRERAEVIARTETAYADVQGNLEAYRESGVVAGKQWITGEGCCDLCDELNGVVVPLDEQFDSDDGSVDGPPLHPNCRCDVVPVLKEPD